MISNKDCLCKKENIAGMFEILEKIRTKPGMYNHLGF